MHLISALLAAPSVLLRFFLDDLPNRGIQLLVGDYDRAMFISSDDRAQAENSATPANRPASQPGGARRLPKVKSDEFMEATLQFDNGELHLRPIRPKSIPSPHSAVHGRSLATPESIDGSDFYDGSISSNEPGSNLVPVASTSSLISAASTSASSFYPAFEGNINSESKDSRPKGTDDRPVDSKAEREIKIQQLHVELRNPQYGDSFRTSTIPGDFHKAPRKENASQKRHSEIVSSQPEGITVEKEQSHASVAVQLGDALKALEETKKQLSAAHKEATEKALQVSQLQERISAMTHNAQLQQKIIDSTREELNHEKARAREAMRERDDLLWRNASLSHQVDYEKREWALGKKRLSMKLSDVTRELELQKMLINGESISHIVQRWESRVLELEGMVADRDAAVRAQQQRIADLNQMLTRGACSISSDSLSSHAFSSKDEASPFTGLRRLVLQYLTSTDYECAQMLSTLGAVLHLSDEEEMAIWQNLRLRLLGL